MHTGPKYERDKGRVPAGGAIPLKSFNNVWRAAEWARATRERRASAYITFHKHCGNARERASTADAVRSHAGAGAHSNALHGRC